jgi:hypothetical protein
MRNKPVELSPDVAKAFIRDMRAFFAETSPLKRDEIASRQIHVLPVSREARTAAQAASGEADVRGDEGSVNREFAAP